ncbi:MAG TPA: hypothetical protein VFU71_04310, partial [Burkholderiaceae bacterium]|nr:hypothetical protein [Burkholderiaceae bacterium]
MALTGQSAYQVGHGAGSDDVDADVATAMRLYMEADLGLGADVAARRARAEHARAIPKAVLRALAASAIDVRDRAVLDLGAGLGAMSEELLLAGARVYALEPGEAWARLTKR